MSGGSTDSSGTMWSESGRATRLATNGTTDVGEDENDDMLGSGTEDQSATGSGPSSELKSGEAVDEQGEEE